MAGSWVRNARVCDGNTGTARDEQGLAQLSDPSVNRRTTIYQDLIKARNRRVARGAEAGPKRVTSEITEGKAS